MMLGIVRRAAQIRAVLENLPLFAHTDVPEFEDRDPQTVQAVVITAPTSAISMGMISARP